MPAIQAHTQAEERPAGVWGGRYRLLTLGLILTVAASAFEALAVATTLPATVRDLGGLSLYGWAFSAFMLTNLVGTTVAGGEADRYGPARPFVVGVGLFSIGLVVGGTAQAMAIVIVGRAVQGFGAGAINSVANVTVARGYPETLRPRMLALISTAWVVPGLVGPALAGLITDHLGWRWVFLGLAPLSPIAAGLALSGLRQLSTSGTIARDWRRIGVAIRLTLGVSLVMAGPELGSAALAVVLACAGVALALPALRRLLPPGTLRAAAGLPAAIATLGLINLAFFGADAFVPLALTAVRGRTVTFAGLALTAATIFWSAGAWIQAHLAPRGRRRILVTSGLGLIAAGIGGVAAGLFPGIPAGVMLLAWAVAGLGIGLAYSTITLVVLESTRPGEEGAASAAMQIVGGLGTAIATGLGGAIIAQAVKASGTPRGGILSQDLLMIGVVGLAMLAAMRLPGRPAGASSTTSPSEAATSRSLT